MSRDLPNKPLVEAILEIKWQFDPEKGDPNYSIFIGRLYNDLESEYPYHEPLPTSMVPEQIAQNIVQHRFRTEKDGWPLVQVGPGIVTLNETVKYTWNDFQNRANELLKGVFSVYPKIEELKINSLLLRYIDAVDKGNIKEDVLDFLRNKLKISIVVPKTLFTRSGTKRRTKAFSLNLAYQTRRPEGTITIKFGTGRKKDTGEALVWETAIQSAGSELPNLPNGFKDWLDAAHAVTDNWFFKLIEGDLKKEFEYEK